MSYVVVEDFRLGVDRRRDRVAGVPGSLYELINAHITSGGEIQKRKAFVPKYSVPNTFGMQASNDVLYVFGSGADPGVPSGVTYQRCQHPDGLAMTAAVYSTTFDGKPYFIGRFSDGTLHHFYNGALVMAWVDGVVRTAMANNAGIATYLAGLLSGASEIASATALGSAITLTGPASGSPVTVEATAVNGGAVDDQTAAVALSVPAIAGAVEVVATATVTINGGTASAGVNKVSSITVNGVDVLGAAVDWAVSNSGTATNIAAQINSNASSPDYTASANGPVVTIIAAGGTGVGPNGFVVVVTVAGDVTASKTDMAGGVAAVAGQAQVSQVTIGGTFEPGDRFTIKLNGRAYGANDNPAQKGTLAFTYKSKLYSPYGSISNFSALNSAIKWDQTVDVGAGFQNVANQDEGSSSVNAIGAFQGSLVYFSNSTAQVWSINADPELNVALDLVGGSGTGSPRSVQQFGNLDLFYLQASGVRSLRNQGLGSSTLTVSDVGSPIDTLVTTAMAALGPAAVAAAVSVMEPVDQRYWLALGNAIYAFSFFQNAKISAWSVYDVGVSFTDFGVIGNRVYGRAGDTIYLYGGDDNATYDTGPDDAYQVRVGLPFLTAGIPATMKTITGVDIGARGSWDVSLLYDPNDENRKLPLATMNGVTYPNQGNGAAGETTHFALELICNTPGPASIANLAISYDAPLAPDPAT